MIPLATVSPPENTKLGPLIHSWALPADEVTCPGASTMCRTECYAKKGHFHYATVKNAHLRNYKFSTTSGFTDWFISTLQSNFVRVLRIHVGGDFYSVDYTRKWQQIVKARPDIQFFGYTRSWRVDAILPELIALSRRPNMSLWWSIDRATGPAPAIRGIRRAYMAVNDVDASLAPDDCDLVFRVNRGTVLKRANGVLVCPPENGQPPGRLDTKITCSRCGICWKKNKASRIDDFLSAAMHEMPAVELLY